MALRPDNVRSADGWEAVLKPVIARYAHHDLKRVFRGMPPSPSRNSLKRWKREDITMPSDYVPIAFCKARLRCCSSAQWDVHQKA